MHVATKLMLDQGRFYIINSSNLKEIIIIIRDSYSVNVIMLLLQQHRCLRSRSYKPPKDPIEVVLQQHFQKVDERCDRLEKLILKQITEQKYLQQGKKNDLGMKSRTLSLLSVDDDPSTSFNPRLSRGYSNELFRESSPVEIETDI